MGCWAQNPCGPCSKHRTGAVPHPREMSGCSGGTSVEGIRSLSPWAGAECGGSSADWFCQGGAPQTPDSAFDGVITAGVWSGNGWLLALVKFRFYLWHVCYGDNQVFFMMIQFPGLSTELWMWRCSVSRWQRVVTSGHHAAPFSSPVIPSFTGIKSLGEGSLQGTSGAGSRCHQAGQGILNPCAIYGPRLYFSDNIKL